MPEPIPVTRDGVIATVTLNRPERLNALNELMWAQLARAMRELSAEDALRCVVVRGAGEKAFAAGADVSEFAIERADSTRAKEYAERMDDALQALARCRHPTVAMIRGTCMGSGLAIAAMCDMRVCGESSRFGIPASRLGLTMSHGELRGLLDLVGRAVTLEMLLEGRVFDAPEALEKRLVNRIVPDARLEEETYALAGRITDGAPLVARWHKQFIERLSVTPPLTEQERDQGYAGFDTEDFRIGVGAFLAKQQPRFKGR